MKKIFLMVIATSVALSGFAQEKAIKNYGLGDNWFIQGQIGGSYSLTEDHSKADLFDMVSPHIAVSLGKHFSPVAGARLQVAGWEGKAYRTWKDKSDKFNYIQTNLDGLLNLTNLFTPYEGDKPFNLYGIMGLGYVHTFGDSDKGFKTTNSIVPRVGLQADFRLNDDLSLNLEAVGNLMSDDFNSVVGGKKYDATANVLVGLTYRFNKSGFELRDVADPAQIAALNKTINDQRSQLGGKDSEIQRLKDELAKKPVPPQVIKEVREDTEVLMNAVVVFRIGSSKLEQNQDINIYNAAKYLQENPKVKITVTGYADRATGNPTINQRLSEQRAQAVADILINKYGITKERIKVDASGDKEQPFSIDAWNRVVIFTAR